MLDNKRERRSEMLHRERSILGVLVALAFAVGACAPSAGQPSGQPSGATGASKPAGSPAAAKPAGATTAPAASGKPSGAPIKIGCIAPLSGPVAAYGAALKYAP